MIKKTIYLIVTLISISDCFSQTADVYYNRGISKGKLHDYRGSITDFTKAIELKPDDSEAYYNRGASKAKLQDHKGAIADFTKAIELKPDFSEAYINRGASKLILGKKDSGCLDFSKAEELGDKDAHSAIIEYCN